jgi:hypothetical protein
MANGHVADEDVLEAAGAVMLVGDSEVDLQVATARRFPRSITTFMRRAKEMATLTPEIAASCIYALPRKENGRQKNIEGPSARLAEICASAWGNLRAEGKVLGHDDAFVTARGTAWDVESNVAIAYEVKRRITTSDGRLYSADMIGVTGNAGASIALRNAIFKAIPTPFWKPIYLACRQVVAGDAKTFASRRDNMIHEFGIMGVTEERLCAAIEVKGKADITLDHMATLAGFFTALKDGDTTIEEAFPEGGGLGAPQPAQRKSQQQNGSTVPGQGGASPSASGSGSASAAAPSPQANAGTAQQPAAPASSPQIGTVVDVQERPGGTLVVLSTGFRCATRDEAMIRAVQALKTSKTRVELVTRAPKDPKNAPVLTEIVPLTDAEARG